MPRAAYIREANVTTALRAIVALLLAASLGAAVAVGRQETSARTATVAPPTILSLPATTTTVPASPLTIPPDPPLPPPPIAASDARVVISPRGLVLPVIAAEVDGFRVRTPCGGEGVVRGWRQVAAAPIVLDPGHGGSEPGAKSPDGQTTEAQVNLGVARQAKLALELQGFPVVLTRNADYRVTIDVRSQIVRALQPRAFVSIHHNAVPDGPRDEPGSETYYQHASAESKRLSGLLYEEIVRALSVYKVAWVSDTDAGAKYRRNNAGDDYYGILRRTKGITAVLAELAFISNQAEADLLRRPEVQSIEGDAVARGIFRFLTTNDPGSGFVQGYERTVPAGSGGGAAGCLDPPLL